MPDDDLKVYHPEILEDQPFPGQEEETTPETSRKTGETLTPTTIKDKKFPTKRIAHETIGSALNTRSRRILAEFSFTEMGAIQIGKYENGVSGDLRISPNGITARDLAGIITFAIDGTTGDAVFRGIVQAKDFVVADEYGLISLNNFPSDNFFSAEEEYTDSISYVDTQGVPSELSFTLTRETKMLFLLTALILSDNSTTNVHTAYVVMVLDDVVLEPEAQWQEYGAGIASRRAPTITTHCVKTVEAGDHVLKIQFKTSNASYGVYLYDRSLTYLTLGR